MAGLQHEGVGVCRDPVTGGVQGRRGKGSGVLGVWEDLSLPDPLPTVLQAFFIYSLEAWEGGNAAPFRRCGNRGTERRSVLDVCYLTQPSRQEAEHLLASSRGRSGMLSHCPGLQPRGRAAVSSQGCWLRNVCLFPLKSAIPQFPTLSAQWSIRER